MDRIDFWHFKQYLTCLFTGITSTQVRTVSSFASTHWGPLLRKLSICEEEIFVICFNYFYLFLCLSESWVSAKKKHFTFAKKKRKKWNKKYIPIFSMQTSSALLLSMLNLLVNWSSSCSWSNDSCTNIKLLLPMYHWVPLKRGVADKKLMLCSEIFSPILSYVCVCFSSFFIRYHLSIIYSPFATGSDLLVELMLQVMGRCAENC